MNNITEKMKMNKTIYVLYHYLKDKKYREYCYDYYKNGRVFWFEHLGTENPGKNIYYIYEGSNYVGMFSLIIWTLRKLEIAERFHLIPVVRWNPEAPVNKNDSDNPFLLYFQPVSDISVDSAMNSADVVYSRRYDRAFGDPASRYDFSNEEVERLGVIYRKYISLRPEIEKSIMTDISGITDSGKRRLLGVHVRGVDWRKSQVKGHPVAFTEQDYLNKAKEMFEKGGYDGLFLATDSETTIKLFSESFGEKLHMFQAKRTEEGSSSLSIFDSKNDPFQLGIEVLRDAIMLSKCDSLLCGLSYVSYGARIIKNASGVKYNDTMILDKGTSEKGIPVAQAGKNQRMNA